jgi:hypothetical protein
MYIDALLRVCYSTPTITRRARLHRQGNTSLGCGFDDASGTRDACYEMLANVKLTRYGRRRCHKGNGTEYIFGVEGPSWAKLIVMGLVLEKTQRSALATHKRFPSPE